MELQSSSIISDIFINEDHSLSDVIIIINYNNQISNFHLHKYPLANASNYFSNLFRMNLSSSKFQLVEFKSAPAIFQLFIRVIYGELIDYTALNILPLLKAFYQFQIRKNIFMNAIDYFETVILKKHYLALQALSNSLLITSVELDSSKCEEYAPEDPTFRCITHLSTCPPTYFLTLVKDSTNLFSLIRPYDICLLLKMMLTNNYNLINFDTSSISAIIEVLIFYLEHAKVKLSAYISMLDIFFNDISVISLDSVLSLNKIVFYNQSNHDNAEFMCCLDESNMFTEEISTSAKFDMEKYLDKILLELASRLTDDHDWLFDQNVICYFKIDSIIKIFNYFVLKEKKISEWFFEFFDKVWCEYILGSSNQSSYWKDYFLPSADQRVSHDFLLSSIEKLPANDQKELLEFVNWNKISLHQLEISLSNPSEILPMRLILLNICKKLNSITTPTENQYPVTKVPKLKMSVPLVQSPILNKREQLTADNFKTSKLQCRRFEKESCVTLNKSLDNLLESLKLENVNKTISLTYASGVLKHLDEQEVDVMGFDYNYQLIDSTKLNEIREDDDDN